MSSKFVAESTCFFVTPEYAVTCAHCLDTKAVGEGETKKSRVWAMNQAKWKVILRVAAIDPALDFALLQVVGKQKAKAVLQLIVKPPSPGDECIFASYRPGLTSLPDEFRGQLAVSKATVNRVTTNRFTYTTSSFVGCSGSALALNGGRVVGMHQESLNSLRERRRLDDESADAKSVADSVDELIQGSAQGALGLLSCSIFEQLRVLRVFEMMHMRSEEDEEE
jgi:hypothetical protein